MQIINKYQCEACKAVYDSEAVAKHCEQSHIYVNQAYVISAEYKQQVKAPFKVVLRVGENELTYYNVAYMTSEDKDA